MIKQIFLISTISFLIGGCNKEVNISQVLTDFNTSKDEVLADGQTTVVLSVRLSEKSSADRRNVVFTTSSGTFIGSGSKEITSKAEYVNGLLIAKATLKVSTKPGNIEVSAQPEFDSPVSEFVLTKTIVANLSEPVSIQLEPSSFGIAANYINEVKVTGFLENSVGKFVSQGFSVVFDDVLLSGSPANGHFNKLQESTADSSKIIAYYSTGAYPIGTQIKLRCTVLGMNEEPTSIKDSIILTVNL